MIEISFIRILSLFIKKPFFFRNWIHIFQMSTLKWTIIKIVSIYQRYLKSVNPQIVFITVYHQFYVNLHLKKMRKLLNTYFQSILSTKDSCIWSSLHIFRVKGAANSRSCQSATCESVYARADGISLNARCSPPIHFDSWSHDALPWYSHTSPLIITCANTSISTRG